MKITFVLPTVGMAGGTRVVAIYAKVLADKGHDVFLVSVPPRQKSQLAKIKDFLTGKGWPKTECAESHLDGLGLNHKVLSSNRQVVDADVPDADVVIATWWETAEWVAELSSAKGAKAYFIQGHEVFEGLPIARVAATYQLQMHKIVIARWLLDVMENEYGDTSVDLVPNSVDHNQFYAESREKQPVPTIGFLFNTAEFKGVDITTKVIRRLKEKIPNLRVVSFGTEKPNEYPEWDESINFYYSPNQQDIRKLYSQCDVWITASRTEGFNLPAMEAMACRAPVVSTKAGWPTEVIVNGVNGFLTEVNDEDGLFAASIKILLAGNDQWRALSQHAFETVENSSWQISADLFEKSLLNAIKKSQSLSSK